MEGLHNVKLEDFISELGTVTLKEFQARFSHPFLVVERRMDERDTRAFRTLSPEEDTRGRTQVRDEEDGEAPLVYEGEPYVYAVQKSGRNAFKNMITVGRSLNNDVVLQHAAVSKLHAFFREEETSSEFSLTDVGSTNGTYLREKLIEPNKAYPIESKQAVYFGGALRGTFFLADDFYGYLDVFRRLQENS
jgi:hypothetical protein